MIIDNVQANIFTAQKVLLPLSTYAVEAGICAQISIYTVNTFTWKNALIVDNYTNLDVDDYTIYYHHNFKSAVTSYQIQS